MVTLADDMTGLSPRMSGKTSLDVRPGLRVLEPEETLLCRGRHCCLNIGAIGLECDGDVGPRDWRRGDICCLQCEVTGPCRPAQEDVRPGFRDAQGRIRIDRDRTAHVSPSQFNSVCIRN